MNEELINKLCELAQIHRATIQEHRDYFIDRAKPRATRDNLDRPNLRFGIYYPCITELMTLYGEVDKWDEKILRVTNGKTSSFTYRRNHTIETPSMHTHTVTFEAMYPNIMLKLYEDNIMKYSNKAFGAMVNDLFKHRSEIKRRFTTAREDTIENYLVDKITHDDIWYLTKILINATYAELGSDSKFKVTHFKSISTYASGQFNQLIEMLGNFVLEINVDTIHLSHYNVDYVKDIVHHVLDKTGLPYSIEEVKKNG